MKRVLVYVLVALMGIGTVWACKKAQTSKPAEFADGKELKTAVGSECMIIVMDTTQALLEGVQVQIGKETYRTSWDGRVLLKNGLPEDFKSMQISCNGYDSMVVKADKLLKQASPYIFKLTPKEDKSYRDYDKDVYYSKGKGHGKVYHRDHASPAVVGAGMMVEEEAPAPEMMPADGRAEMRPFVGGETNNAKAGSLTAGEVNDFAKWYFWTKVIGETHKQYISDWKILPEQRYTVQVTNKDGYPIASRAVSLLDAKGNTLFQAVTDNTGKAELWASLIGEQQNVSGLQIRVDDKVIAAKPWEKGLNTFVMDEPCEVSDAVDVMFVFDATGSMTDELHYLQAEMRDVIARAKDATGGLAIRTGAVVYRDHGDVYLTRISRLTDDIKTTQAFIDKQYASGGGDFPEAIPEALMAALNSAGWDADARARIAFLVLDAPCHKDGETLKLLHEQILNAAAQGVRIVPVVCSGLDESGELLMRSLALATNGTSFFLTDDSGIGHTHLKPMTDTLKVEHLNDMLVRTIVEFSMMPKCGEAEMNQDGVDENFIPNPFGEQDMTNIDVIPHGSTTVYLLDITGKLIAVLEGDVNTIEVSKATYPLSTGVYFLKAFIDGRWYTKKILVR